MSNKYMRQTRSITEGSERFTRSKHLFPKHASKNIDAVAMEGLRIQTIRKLQSISGIFKKNQKQLSNFFVKYQPMPQSEINVRRIIEDRFEEIRLVKTTNKIYFGTFRGKERYGDGILIDQTRKIYEGNFIQNVKSGHGVEIYPNTNIYIGEFSANKKHGHGKFYWFNLSYPTDLKASEVEFYQGTWWGGLPDGNGLHQKASGDLYQGQFKNGLKHGKGNENFANGDHYRGQYINGLPEGFGTYKWADGSNYVGEFKQGLRNGQGKWRSVNNNEEYEGNYILDKKCGYGEYKWSFKDYLYKGHFENDVRHGYGELFFRGELEYKGEWISGQTQLELNASVRSKRSASVKSRSRLQTPKSQKLPSLSRFKKTTSVKQFDSRSSAKQRNTFQRSSPSPKSHLSSYKNITRVNSLKNPIKLTSVKQRIKTTVKKRPMSYHRNPIKLEKPGMEFLPKYQIVVRECRKKNCGCNAHFIEKSKKKTKRRPITHLATQPMCF